VHTFCSHLPFPPSVHTSGAYLAKCFNGSYAALDADALPDELPAPAPVRPAAAPFGALGFLDLLFAPTSKFRYVERGSMASMGFGRGIVDASKTGTGAPQLTGFAAFVSWRGAYLSKQLSWSNMLLVPMYWFKSWCFGRDISRF